MPTSGGRLALDAVLRTRGRLSVLGYHRVLPVSDPLLAGSPSAEEFARTMGWVKEVFNVLPLSDALRALLRGSLPPRALAITFDDGYANNFTVAAPILARLGLPATFFLATGFLDGGRMFNDTIIEAVRAAKGDELDLTRVGLGRHAIATMDDRRAAIAALLAQVKYRPLPQRAALVDEVAAHVGARLPDDLMMTTDQAVRLAGNTAFDLGGHTVNHPILARLPDDEAAREIEQGRREVADIAGRPVGVFAYPNGWPERDYTARTVQLVRRAGFLGAVTASAGAASTSTDPFQIPRFTPWDTAPLRFVARLLNNAMRVEPRLLPVEVTISTELQ